MFESPQNADYHITEYLSDVEIQSIANDIKMKKEK